MNNIDFGQIVTADDKARNRRFDLRARAMAQLSERLDQVSPVAQRMAEIMAWPAKEAAAHALLAGTARAADVALLKLESASTGETDEDLARLVVSRADHCRRQAVWVTGLRRKYEARLEGAANDQEILDILSDFDRDRATGP